MYKTVLLSQSVNQKQFGLGIKDSVEVGVKKKTPNGSRTHTDGLNESKTKR